MDQFGVKFNHLNTHELRKRNMDMVYRNNWNPQQPWTCRHSNSHAAVFVFLLYCHQLDLCQHEEPVSVMPPCPWRPSFFPIFDHPQSVPCPRHSSHDRDKNSVSENRNEKTKVQSDAPGRSGVCMQEKTQSFLAKTPAQVYSLRTCKKSCLERSLIFIKLFIKKRYMYIFI